MKTNELQEEIDKQVAAILHVAGSCEHGEAICLENACTQLELIGDLVAANENLYDEERLPSVSDISDKKPERPLVPNIKSTRDDYTSIIAEGTAKSRQLFDEFMALLQKRSASQGTHPTDQ